MAKPPNAAQFNNRKDKAEVDAKQNAKMKVEFQNDQNDWFEKSLKRRRLTKADLVRAKAFAKLCKNSGRDPDSKNERTRDLFEKLLKKLQSFAKDQQKDLKTELGPPSKKFYNKSNVELTDGTIAHVAIAVIAFIVAIDGVRNKLAKK